MTLDYRSKCKNILREQLELGVDIQELFDLSDPQMGIVEKYVLTDDSAEEAGKELQISAEQVLNRARGVYGMTIWARHRRTINNKPSRLEMNIKCSDFEEVKRMAKEQQDRIEQLEKALKQIHETAMNHSVSDAMVYGYTAKQALEGML